jgi:hypothetical protein
MIYCPQCGSGMSETTKFCKNCGLPLAQVQSYVTTGGTAPLTPLPPSTPPGSLEGLTPRQQKKLTIMMFILAPMILGALGGALHAGRVFGPLAGIAFLLMPLGIMWAKFRYEAQEQRLRQQPWYPQEVPPPPLAQGNVYQPPLPPHQTNPLSDVPPVRGSVVEDETQRLPENRRRI